MTTPNIEEACQHYRALKSRMGEEAPDDLTWYESAGADAWKGWHHSTITKDNYFRLFYRIVWTSGFKAQTVFDKEKASFELLYRTLYPGGIFHSERMSEFLTEVQQCLAATPKTVKMRLSQNWCRL